MNLLIVSISGDIAKPDGGHAGHAEVEGGDVHGVGGRPAAHLQAAGAVTVQQERLVGLVSWGSGVGWFSCGLTQGHQPAVLHPTLQVPLADHIPEAGKPVADDQVEADHHEQQQQGGLQEPVEGPRHPAKAEQAHHLATGGHTGRPPTFRMLNMSVWELPMNVFSRSYGKQAMMSIMKPDWKWSKNIDDLDHKINCFNTLR